VDALRNLPWVRVALRSIVGRARSLHKVRVSLDTVRLVYHQVDISSRPSDIGLAWSEYTRKYAVSGPVYLESHLFQ
jgi:hypothetical protein